MPKTKTQGFIFGVIMSYAMAFGMEIYNTAINQGVHLTGAGFSAMTNHVFPDALKEMSYMGLFVILFSNLWGNRIGAAFATRHCNPQKDNPYFCQIMRQAGTVAIMCPTMSLVASILFNVIIGGDVNHSAARHLVWNCHKKFPDGFLLEYVRCGTIYTLAIQSLIP